MTTIGARTARRDVLAYRGEPVDFTLPILDRTGAAVAAIDLTGWTVTAKIAGGAAFDATITADGIRVTASGAQTATWTWPPATWDLVLVDDDDDLHPFCTGTVQILPLTP